MVYGQKKKKVNHKHYFFMLQKKNKLYGLWSKKIKNKP